MNSDSKTVRGLSIAIVVLAALGILGVIAGYKSFHVDSATDHSRARRVRTIKQFNQYRKAT